MDWPTLRPHKLQSQAWFTDKKFVILACGRGSGKTELARRRCVRNLAVSHNLPTAYHAFCLPTFAQARRVAWEPLKALVPPEWIVGEPREGDMSIETIFNSKLFVVGLDKPQRIEGTQWSSIVIDESSDVKPGTFNKSILPALTHHCFSCWRIGVPKRQGIGAPEFRSAFEQADPRTTFAASWKTADIVPEEALRDAKETLDKVDYDEQYEAIWQKMGGGIFHSYDDVHNVSVTATYRANQPVIVMSDFNVDPMSWCLGHFIDGIFCIFDELSLRSTHTQATLDVLCSRYPDHEGGWLFTGDASAQSSNTRADSSDYIQIYNDQRFKNRRVVYPSHNPSKATRFSATNAALCNAAGRRRVLIHPKCKQLRNDLMVRHYKTGTREPNDTQFVGHMSDAFGYGVMLVLPLSVQHNESPKVFTSK